MAAKKSYQYIFDSPNKDDSKTYAREVIHSFMQRAFRRPLNPGELNRYLNFWENIKDDFDRFEDGIKEVLIAVLCSPNFIYLYETKIPELEESEDQFYLASKLSYFLWNSPPDKILTDLATKGDLVDELSDQINRMIDSPKIKELVNSFTYEWLRLDRYKKY